MRFVLFALLLLIALPAQAETTPSSFVQGLGDRVLAILDDQTISDEQADVVFRQLMTDSFDLTRIGRFVLGNSAWRRASPEQQQTYMTLFHELVVQIYSDRFSNYSGEKFVVTGADDQGNGEALVDSEIRRPDGSRVAVNWRVRTDEVGFRITDVIVEGVSMSVTQRAEFASVLQQNAGDLEPLLARLRDKTSRKIATKRKPATN